MPSLLDRTSNTVADSPPADPSQPDVAFIGAPGDPDLQTLFAYWNALRRGRLMPSRADFDPVRVPKLLPHIILYNVAPAGGYTVRLVGEAVEAFIGRNTTGSRAGTLLNDRGLAAMTEILDAVCRERAPRFRRGKIYWVSEKNHRAFEACFLPLSADGETVNIILAAAKFQ